MQVFLSFGLSVDYTVSNYHYDLTMDELAEVRDKLELLEEQECQLLETPSQHPRSTNSSSTLHIPLSAALLL